MRSLIILFADEVRSAFPWLPPHSWQKSTHLFWKNRKCRRTGRMSWTTVFFSNPSVERYSESWGTEGANAKKVRYTWKFTICNIMGIMATFSFDNIDGRSPLTIGLNQNKIADTPNNHDSPVIIHKRSIDKNSKRFILTFKKTVTETNDYVWSWSIITILQNTLYLRRKELILTWLHRRKLQKVANSFDICAQSGPPLSRKKVFMTHVNEAFNKTLQIEFLKVFIRNIRYLVLKIICAVTNSGEGVTVPSRSTKLMTIEMECEWLYHHGAPKYFGADPQLCSNEVKAFSAVHQFELKICSSCSSHKKRSVERNNGVPTEELNRIAKEKSTADAETLVKRASFKTNMFHENSRLSSF